MKTRGDFSHGFPRGVIVHFSAGHDDAKGMVAWGRGEGYAYDAIDSKGQLYVAHALGRWGYHAGESYWPSLGSGVSQYLRGIENCNAGRLEKVGPGQYKSWFGKIYGEDEVRYSPGWANIKPGYYHKFSTIQEERLITHILWMKTQNPIVFDLDLVLGHDEVAPKRKNDPGASLSMPMPSFRDLLKRRWAEQTKIQIS